MPSPSQAKSGDCNVGKMDVLLLMIRQIFNWRVTYSCNNLKNHIIASFVFPSTTANASRNMFRFPSWAIDSTKYHDICQWGTCHQLALLAYSSWSHQCKAWKPKIHGLRCKCSDPLHFQLQLDDLYIEQ